MLSMQCSAVAWGKVSRRAKPSAVGRSGAWLLLLLLLLLASTDKTAVTQLRPELSFKACNANSMQAAGWWKSNLSSPQQQRVIVTARSNCSSTDWCSVSCRQLLRLLP